jgi:tRNA-splicing ligase RtcB
MMDRVMTELSYLWFKANRHQAEIEQERINCHHNFTQLGSHFGRHVWLTRKGAIQMRKGAARGDSGLNGNTELHRRRAGESDGVFTRLPTAPDDASRAPRHDGGSPRTTWKRRCRGSSIATRKSSSTSFSVPTRTSTR